MIVYSGGRGQLEARARGGRGEEEEGGLRGHAAGRHALQEPGGAQRGRGGRAQGMPGGAQGRRAVGAVQERGEIELALDFKAQISVYCSSIDCILHQVEMKKTCTYKLFIQQSHSIL